MVAALLKTAPPAAPSQTAGDDARFEAVRRRDRSFDGTFVHAVRTTGVYCRPGCAARRAKRANISFYDSAEAAEAAGFRPCKRCRPEAAPEDERRARPRRA